MIDKENNIRFNITISKKQYQWLTKQSNKLHISKSEFITWILSRKAREISEYLYLKKYGLSEMKLDELIKIAKAPWLDD